MHPHSRPQDLRHPCSPAHRKASWEVHTDENFSLTEPGTSSTLGNQETPQVLAPTACVHSQHAHSPWSSLGHSKPRHWAPSLHPPVCLPVRKSIDALVALKKEKISETKRSECTKTLVIIVSWGWRLKKVPSWGRNKCANEESGI